MSAAPPTGGTLLPASPQAARPQTGSLVSTLVGRPDTSTTFDPASLHTAGPIFVERSRWRRRCPTCGAEFTYKRGLDRHRDRQHGG